MIDMFEMPDAARALNTLSDDARDALPFGVIRLSPAGLVETFSKTEAAQSGFPQQRALGRDFFEHVAPCMNTPAFRGRIAEQAQRGTLDLEFGHTGDFTDPSRFMRVRVCSAHGGGMWILLKR